MCVDDVKLTCNVRVGGRLERAETVADDEDAGAEAAKGLGLEGGNGAEGADAVEAETPDEDGAVAVVAEDPGGVADGGEGVCSVLLPSSASVSITTFQSGVIEPSDQGKGKGIHIVATYKIGVCGAVSTNWINSMTVLAALIRLRLLSSVLEEASLAQRYNRSLANAMTKL